MKSGMKDKLEGNLHEAKGEIKAVAGKVTGKPELQRAGRNEKAAGKLQKKVGQVKSALGK